MRLVQFLLQRAARLILTVLLIASIVFVVVRVLPGDPALTIAGVDATKAEVQSIREKLGTDIPIGAQYFRWIWNLVHFDLGTSYTSGESVNRLISERFPLTLSLAMGAFALSLIIAVPLGVLAAVRRWTFVDFGIMAYTQAGLAIPSFWLGILLLLAFAVKLRWFPLFGGGDLRHLALPIVALGVERSALLIRIIRGSVSEELGREYVLTARAKGLHTGRILFGHALRNGLLPVITVSGIQLGYLLGGVIIIEQVFSLPGLGRLFLTGVYDRDYPLIQGGVIFVAFVFSLINFSADVLYSVANPRVRVG